MSSTAGYAGALVATAGVSGAWYKRKLSGPKAAVAVVLLALLARLYAKFPIFLVVKLNQLSRSLLGLKREPWPLEEWIALHSEEAIEPEMEIVDAHHHLWDPSSHPKGWPAPQWILRFFYMHRPSYICQTTMIDTIARNDTKVLASFGHRQVMFTMPYMGKELMDDIRNAGTGKRGHNIVQTVYLECGWAPPEVPEALKPVGEAHMVKQVHARYPGIGNAIVAYAKLDLPDVERTLQEYAKIPEVRGIRCSLAWSSDPTIVGSGVDEHASRSKEFRAGFALLQKYNLSYDTWMFHEQLEDVTDLVKSFPEQVVIIDHVAMPLGRGKYSREGTFPVWEKGIRELAAASTKNVYVKLSGLAMCNCGFGFDLRSNPPNSRELADAWGPYFKVVLDAFGVSQCMFASNFPVDKVSTDYTVMWNAFKLIVADRSVEDKRALFYENAKRAYRL